MFTLTVHYHQASKDVSADHRFVPARVQNSVTFVVLQQTLFKNPTLVDMHNVLDLLYQSTEISCLIHSHWTRLLFENYRAFRRLYA